MWDTLLEVFLNSIVQNNLHGSRWLKHTCPSPEFKASYNLDVLLRASRGQRQTIWHYIVRDLPTATKPKREFLIKLLSLSSINPNSQCF